MLQSILPLTFFLRADNCTSIKRLRQLVKKLGLRRLSRRFGLNDDQYEDLLALESYINWTNNSGHSDITTRSTRDNFDTFIGVTFNANNLIMYDKHKAAASREHLRFLGDIGENGDTRGTYA